MKRTIGGLTITNEPLANGTTTWHTVDGEYHIVMEKALTFCDNPHPERSGRFGGFRCPGNEEHEYEVGYILLDKYGNEAFGDVNYPTLKEAHQALADHLTTQNLSQLG